jgi:amidohydrolase
VDGFDLVVKGRDAHGAYPHQGFDAIVIAAQVINALQTVVSRRLDPTEGRVITIGTIEGGTKENIITGKVSMTGSIRTFDKELRENLLAEMERACGVAQALGGDYELTIRPGFMAIINDPAMTELVWQTGINLLGEENVNEGSLEMGAEDFSYFAEKAPGCLFSLGGAVAEGPPRMHHHPCFDVDERCLPIGAALLAESALRYLKQAGKL